MILVDTSAWIEFLRDTGSPVCTRVDELLADEIAVCDAVRMEVLAGARDESHLVSLRRLLARATVLPTLETDYEDAAALYRRCRRRGETVRRLIDCLIASVAVRADVPVLHNDGDSTCSPATRNCESIAPNAGKDPAVLPAPRRIQPEREWRSKERTLSLPQ